MRHTPERRAPRLVYGLSCAAFAALGSSLVACGASITALYEGDVRFEHCMAIDEVSTSEPWARVDGPDAKASHRAACWTEWLTHYSYGQTRDRIEYAKRRVRKLEGGQPESPGAEPSPAGVPTTPHAPPPMVERADAGAPTASAAASAPPPPSPPGASCAATCGDAWQTCQKTCTVVPCERSCATKYRACMKRCY